MTVNELMAEENQLRTEMWRLRVGNTTKELENTAKIKMTRRNLARVLTALRAKEIQEQLAAQPPPAVMEKGRG
jgi:large subunit ribosomal protein L29